MSEPTVGLQAWFDQLLTELDTGGFTLDEDTVHIVLDLSRDAAHHVNRAAGPLTTFLLGVAVGRGASLGATAARITELAQPVAGPDFDEGD
ncbi:DUF6457 domain-containing protein [Granulicoccus phenolivorans]|uniref:DUF6457 domain-containing protein n=1 Tax=Granulicoccus phenolivorans TaxID=266854 RepID=UPI0004289E5A|nr:DUF6457 domain-containing protein [Granulicoccus phenolivorans]